MSTAPKQTARGQAATIEALEPNEFSDLLQQIGRAHV